MSYSKAMRRSGRFFTGLGAAAALQACAVGPNPAETARRPQLLPTEQYGLAVTNEPEQIALGLHADGLSASQQAALGQFVSRWRLNGGGPVTLRVPVGGIASLSRRMEAEAKAYLVKLGIPQEQVVLEGYPSGSNASAPLLASYERFEARGPNCSGGWRDIMSTGRNTPYDHFGCALTANFAAQVANPRDFLAPAVETPADNSRRSVVLGKYRQGLLTSSAKDDQANGKVSDTGGGGN